MTSPSMTAADVLREARRLIAEKGWTQGWAARDGRSLECDFRSSAAACFCMVGSVWAADIRTYTDPMLPVWSILARVVGTEYFAEWNDRRERTKEEVLAAFDRAILLASSPGDQP